MSKRSFLVITATLIGLVFIFGEALSLYAQDKASDEFTLEEITVTAQKRAEDQQKVAIAMDVITGDQLAESGKTNVDDILSSISNVMINKSSDGMRVSVRGLTETDSAFMDLHATTPQVAINVDGAYNSSNRSGTNLFDVERVEVLYGPQSTMYASNSPGGIVNVVTAAPKTDKYSVSASAEYGSYSLVNLNFAGNAPIVKDALAMRLAAQIYKKDPFVEGSSGEDNKSARLKTLWQASDMFSTTVTVNYTKRINGGMMGGQVKPFDYQDGYWYTGSASDGFTKNGKVTDPWTAPPARAAGGAPGAPMTGPNAATQTTKGVTADINLDTAIGNLSVVPQYSKTSSNDRGNYTGTDGGTYAVHTQMKQTQKGLEARMTSAEDFLFKWILGVNYYKDENSRYTVYNEPGTTNRTMGIFQKSKAVFGNITYPFTDKFRGTAGYRQSWDEAGSIMLPPQGATSGITGNEYSNPDYKVGIEYDLAANSMLYADYATSYRVNPLAMEQEGRTIKPEELKAYTVGAKNRFLNNKVQLNAAAYYYDYKNKSAPMMEAGRQTTGQTILENSIVDRYGNRVDYNGDGLIDETSLGRVNDLWSQQMGDFRSIGLDVSVDWVLTSNDKVSLGISYLDAKWKKMLFDFYYKQLNEDGTIGYLWPDDGKDFSGYTNIYSPKWTITSSYEHNFELGSFGVLVPHIDIQYKSKYVLDYTPASAMLSYQEPYYIINGSFTFTHSSGIWTFNAYVKNATNYAAKNFFDLQNVYLGISDPRTFGGVFSIKF